MNWRGIAPPTISILELEAAAARERLDLEPAIAVLAAAAGLALVLALGLGAALDGFLVGNLGRLKFNFYIKFALELLDRDLDMHLPRARQDDLVGLRVAMGLEGAVLLDQMLQRLRGFLLVALGLGPNRKGDDRRAAARRLGKMTGDFSSHSVSPVVVSLSLATATISPGSAVAIGDCFLPFEPQELAEALAHAASRVEHRRVACGASRDYAKNRQLAGERIDDGLEDEGRKRRRRIGRALDRLARWRR